MRAIEFDRISGGRAFNPNTPWFETLLKEIGQPLLLPVAEEASETEEPGAEEPVEELKN